jgi:hypothetical protein
VEEESLIDLIAAGASGAHGAATDGQELRTDAPFGFRLRRTRSAPSSLVPRCDPCVCGWSLR